MLDMSEENFGELSRKVTNTKQILRHGRVDRMSIEVEILLLNSCFDTDSIDDVLLRSVLDSNETKSERDILSFDHSLGISTFVHDIDFGNDTDGSNTFWI